MIELTKRQVRELEHPKAIPPRVINPVTQDKYVLLKVEEYERLKNGYDDSPWTDEEMALLASEAGQMLDSFECHHDHQ
jgi:hypothetical protein